MYQALLHAISIPMKISSLLRSSALAIGLIGFSAGCFANSISFATSVGIQPSNVGTITLTQVSSTTVNVLLDFSAANYGLINTGGPHTPFAFNLKQEDGVTISFIQPLNGNFTSGLFSLNLNGGANTPYGSYGVAIDSTQGNGSGNAYYSDFEFNLSRTNGLLLTDFIANASGYYFSADLTDGRNTGAQAWGAPEMPSVPEAGTSVILLGLGLVSLAFFRRKAA